MVFKTHLMSVDDIIENYSRRTTQDDGATVYIQRVAGRGRRHNIKIKAFIAMQLNRTRIYNVRTAMTAITINFNNVVKLNDDQFYQLCQDNPDVKFERNANGELIVMPPTGGETGKHNASIIGDFVIWNRQTKLGEVFDSSTCFKLPNGSDRSPDVSWIKLERWNALKAEQREKFPPIAPDFVLELMSPSDSLSVVQAKMQEYMNAGVKLGWLIDRKTCRVEIYRQGQPKEVLESPTSLSGEDILPGFVLNLVFVWG